MNAAKRKPRLSRTAEQVLQQIRAWILEHHLEPGSRLPSERDLAGRLEVSQRQVRAAVEQLQTEGLIQPVSERIRMVAPDGAGPTAVFANSVVIFSTVQFSTMASGRDPRNMTELSFLGAAHAVQQAGLNFLALHPNQMTLPKVQALLREPPLGVVMTEEMLAQGTAWAEVLRLIEAASVPVAVHGDALADPALAQTRFDTVHADHRQGTRDLCRRLLAKGCRRLLRCWDSRLLRQQPHWLAERDAGYEEACREAGLPVLPPVPMAGVEVPGDNLTADDFALERRAALGMLYDAVRESPAAEPLGLVLATDAQVAPVTAACRALGREPGRDVWVAGFDDYWHADSRRRFEPAPPLATVNKHEDILGRGMVELLRDRLAQRLGPAPVRRTFPVEVIDR